MRRNPNIGSQLDLFEGESPIHIPLEDLTEEQIKELPRGAFSENEWDELDEDVQEYIYENSDVDRERIKKLAEFLTQQYRWAMESDSFDEGSEFETFESWLNHAVWEGRAFNVAQDLADELVDSYTEAGYDEEQVKEAFKEAIEDQNNWTSEFTDNASGATYYHELLGSIYIQPGDLEFNFDDDTKFFESDIDAVLEYLEGGDYEEQAAAEIYENAYFKSKFWDVLSNTTRYPEVSIYDLHTGMYFMVDLNHDAVREAVGYELGAIEPITPEGELPEERRIMELKDGFYVADLSPRELPIEGKKQGICVGQPQYGYAKAVRQGVTRILSLRRPSGKPLLTFEVSLDDGVPYEIEQIKVYYSVEVPGTTWGKQPA